MQENSSDQPPSLAQLLRESYLAEAKAQQRHSEMSRSDASSLRLQIYGSLKGKAEDSGGHNDSQFPDLSAFLSQEELDESVNLACQAIGQEPREDRAEVKPSVTPLSPSNIQPASVSSSEPLSVPSANISPAPLTSPAPVSITQPAPELKELPPAHTVFTSDRKMPKAYTRQENMSRTTRDSNEGFNDPNKSAKNVPYGPENQSKKEFLNKAADFIEELSSLFKSNSTKRVRPRSCKAHRSRTQNKSQLDGTVYPLTEDNRERSPMSVGQEEDGETPCPAVGPPAEVQLDSGIGQVEFPDCRITEEQQQQQDSVSQGVEEEEVEEEAAVSCALTEPPYPAEPPVCEPPHFIQKLKSREVSEGCKVQLDCIVRGLPVPEVRWFCEGKELENSPDIQIVTSGESHSLIITEAFEEDTGRYSCFASNFYGTDSTSAEIYVEATGASSTDSEGEQNLEQLDEPQTTSFPPSLSQTLSLGEEDTLTTQPTAATEEPAEQISSPPSYQIIPEPLVPIQTSATLLPVTEISQTSAAASAYTAQEETAQAPVQVLPVLLPAYKELSDARAVSTSVSVTSTPAPVQTAAVIATSLPLDVVVPSVPSAPTQTPQSQTYNSNYLQGLNGQPIIAAPVFTRSLQDIVLSEGQLVVLECRVKGLPSPRVDWYREGKLIEDSPDFRVLQKKPRSPAESEEICTLVIAEVFPEDSGLFTCTASNKYGTVSSTAELKVKANGNISNHMRPLSSSTAVPTPTQESSLSAPAVNLQPEVTVTNSIKPHSSTIRLDPLISSTLRLDPLNTSTLRLDPQTSSMLRPDPLRNSLPSLDPSSLSSSSGLHSRSTSTPNLDPFSIHQSPPGPGGARLDPHIGGQVLAYPKPFTSSFVVETSSEQNVSKPSVTLPDTNLKVRGTPNHKNGSPTVVPLPDPPPNSCLKSGTLTNHRDSRSSSRAGRRRVHFRLPEDEEEERSKASSQSDEDSAAAGREPPPVLAKPKLDPAQLQLLHNQVLMEQQQDTEPQTQTHIQPQSNPPVQIQPQVHPPSQIQPQVQSSNESLLWSPRTNREPHPPPFQSHVNATTPLQQVSPSAAPGTSGSLRTNLDPHPPPFQSHLYATAPLQQTSHSIAPLISSTPTPSLSSVAALNTAFSPPFNTYNTPPKSSPSSIPQLKTQVTSPPPAPMLKTNPTVSLAPVTQMNTIHASHLNLAPSALARSASATHVFSPPASKFVEAPSDSTLTVQQVTSSSSLLRTSHSSLMNLSATSHSFNYARPKEFLSAQTFSPIRSPSPTESPVPLLLELAAELNSSAASSPTLPPFSPPPTILPTRVLMSPTSPTSLVSSPTPGSSALLNSMFSLRAQSPPQASSPTSSGSSPIQNPVAFLSSVLPSLTPSQPRNSMGLPRGAPVGPKKNVPKTRRLSTEDIRESKEILLQDIEKKLRSRDDTLQFAHQQKLSFEGKAASRPLGPIIPATVINYDEEYKVSNFEQRLMSEIEFRLERTPVEESDDEVQHQDIPTGKCIAPIFDKKLKNFRAMEGVPVTFSCKIVGIPTPKVYWFKDGKQILRRNLHYRKIREGDGTCALHIECTTNDDDGNYTIMAANPQGRISCSGHLLVQTGPPRNRMTPIHSQRVRARIQEVEEGEQTQERFFQPHFLQAPGDMLSHEGQMCRLDCKVSGLPSPELMWLVNGKPIYPDYYHKMLVRENGIHSLVIDPLMQNDAGTYTCIASNKAGQSSFSLDLTVVEKEMKHPPQFVEKLQNMGIPEGSPVRLECRVVGMPPPLIFWKKDNDTIPRTKPRMSMTQDATGYVCLLIQPTTKDDAGWYTVSAKNEAGITSCTCRLDIYAQWHQSVPAPAKRAPRPGSRYAALTGQGLDIKSAFPTSDTNPILFSSSPPEAMLESEEL